MKNPIRIRTRVMNDRFFDIYLYNDRRMFKDDEDEILRNEKMDIIYSGESSNLPNQTGVVKEGTRVTFRLEGQLDKVRRGRVVSLKTTPFFEVEEEMTKNHFGVHRKYLKSTDPTFKEIAEMYIEKLGQYQYRKYDLGAVKSRQKTFLTAEESLTDLASKGVYIIMMISEV